MKETDTDQHIDLQQRAGAGLLYAGAILALLIFIDRSGSSLISLPGFWYRSRSLHLLFCIGALVGGVLMLRRPQPEETSESSDDSTKDEHANAIPFAVFDSVRFYTRPNCHLCDDARQILQAYASWLPEIELVDISGDGNLEERFGECVPVVEMDGQVRFRARIDEWALERMITARRTQRAAIS